MIERCEWLPDLVMFRGNWEEYVAILYRFFKADFVESKPIFQNKRVGYLRDPIFQEKEFTFWHCTSEGEDEELRTPDFRRCERIRWPKPIIEHSNDPSVRCWRNKRGSDIRVLLWFYEENYLVVLTERKTYAILWTTYYIEENNRKKKLLKEYESYQEGLKNG